MKKTLFSLIALIGLICVSCNSFVSPDTNSDANQDQSSSLEVQNSKVKNKYLSNDLAFFGLYGHVKMVKEDGITSLEFDQNGTLVAVFGTPASQRYIRDNQGRIVEMNGYENHVEYEWGDELPIASVAQAEGMTLNEAYTYDERGFVVEISHSDDGDESVERFTYTEVDKQGNWTKRTSEGYEYTAGTTTRVIEYYD